MGGIDILRAACQTVATDDDFWLLACITERSYEEGARNKKFAESIRTFEQIGISPGLAQRLKGGINENLENTLQRNPAVIGKVKRNSSRVPDIEFHVEGGPVLCEVKLIYDCTYRKYYREVVNDRRKLQQFAPSIDAIKAQVVFFVQVPNFRYPAGRWYGGATQKGRDGWAVNCGIDLQYPFLRSQGLPDPSWPTDGRPWVKRLCCPGDEITEVFISRWLQNVFVPTCRWDYSVAEQLREAAVGVAIWEITD